MIFYADLFFLNINIKKSNMQTLIIVLTVATLISDVLIFIGEKKGWNLALFVCCVVGFFVSFAGWVFVIVYITSKDPETAWICTNNLGLGVNLLCGCFNVVSSLYAGINL